MKSSIMQSDVQFGERKVRAKNSLRQAWEKVKDKFFNFKLAVEAHELKF